MGLGSILTVAGIVVLFVFGIIALQYCINAWDMETPQREQSENRRGSSRGADPELLRSLPVTVYHGSDKGRRQQGAVECAVCLAELQDGEEARFLPRCGHGFHAECVDTWLASHTTCPLCRLTVSKPDDGTSPPPHHPVSFPPVSSEPANYASSVLLGVTSHGAVTADAGSRAAMVIEIPELAVPTPTLTLHVPAKCQRRIGVHLEQGIS